jgi:hypothetical protein
MNIQDALNEVLVILARQEEQLREHIRRTQLNEDRIDHVEEKWERIDSHLNKMEGAVNVFKWGGAAIAALYTIVQLYTMFHK